MAADAERFAVTRFDRTAGPEETVIVVLEGTFEGGPAPARADVTLRVAPPAGTETSVAPLHGERPSDGPWRLEFALSAAATGPGARYLLDVGRRLAFALPDPLTVAPPDGDERYVSLVREVNALRHQLTAAQQETERVRALPPPAVPSELAGLRRQLEEAQDELAAARLAIGSSRDEVAGLRREAERARGEAGSALAEAARLRRELAEARARLDGAGSEEAAKQLEQARVQRAQALAELDRAREQLAAAQELAREQQARAAIQPPPPPPPPPKPAPRADPPVTATARLRAVEQKQRRTRRVPEARRAPPTPFLAGVVTGVLAAGGLVAALLIVFRILF